jgi:hypothetical protein
MCMILTRTTLIITALLSLTILNCQADTLSAKAYRVAQSLRASHVDKQTAQAITYKLAWEEYPHGTGDPRFARFILQVQADFEN